LTTRSRGLAVYLSFRFNCLLGSVLCLALAVSFCSPDAASGKKREKNQKKKQQPPPLHALIDALPSPTASPTPPFSCSIFRSRGLVFFSLLFFLHHRYFKGITIAPKKRGDRSREAVAGGCQGTKGQQKHKKLLSAARALAPPALAATYFFKG
jgi:hypothetical protein